MPCAGNKAARCCAPVLSAVARVRAPQGYRSIAAGVVRTTKRLFEKGHYDTLYVTGHSLGGAVAQLAVVDLFSRLGRDSSNPIGAWFATVAPASCAAAAVTHWSCHRACFGWHRPPPCSREHGMLHVWVPEGGQPAVRELRRRAAAPRVPPRQRRGRHRQPATRLGGVSACRDGELPAAEGVAYLVPSRPWLWLKLWLVRE